jgi:hypothetical protein
MTAESDFQPDWINSCDDPLVARLRQLRLTRAPAEARERCWEQIKAAIEQPQAGYGEQPVAAPLRDYDRFTFTIRHEPRRPNLADRWSGAGSRPLLAAH